MNIELDAIDYSSLNEEKVKEIVESAKQAQKERDEAKQAAENERKAKENLTAELIEERIDVLVGPLDRELARECNGLALVQGEPTKMLVQERTVSTVKASPLRLAATHSSEQHPFLPSLGLQPIHYLTSMKHR